ncbi:AAA family ATPase [Jannaschia sp. Os4]|uniref:ExeA family protein n=1 Tax=Jannaschia sp. Os4 TaxID=2807617 RepID=UPI00193A9633|nr:AAA family ATPase [Jannaschia sp. Os4]MBM2575141.1 AAA family ATPase [Jannaschia sp. Os4]
MASLDVYAAHYGLSDRPFSLVPDPAYLYWSPDHARAHAVLEYGVLTCAPITLVTGEIGAGKTTLMHRFLDEAGDDLCVGLMSSAWDAHEDLLLWVLTAFGEEVDTTLGHVCAMRALQAFLIERYAAGQRCVLIVDEAQNLGRRALEELRMLTNINARRDELLQIVLIGQPELRDAVRGPGMEQLAQRIAAAAHLKAMDAATTAGYVAHRLEVAGATTPIFDEAACVMVAEATGGIPRLVNQLCELALVYGMAAEAPAGETPRVTAATVREVLDDGLFFAARPTPAAAVASEPVPVPLRPRAV